MPLLPKIVEATLGPVIVSLPVEPLIVNVSLPLAKVPAVMVEKEAVSPEPTSTTIFDVPAAVSLRAIASPVSCKLVNVAVRLAPENSICSILSKLLADIFAKSVVVTTEIISVPPLDASVMDSPASTSFVLNTYVSSPEPPVKLSAPSPPLIVSLPASPIIVSLPDPPERLSFPAPPVILKSPEPDWLRSILAPALADISVN